MSEKKLNPDGLYRWRDIAGMVPVSRETWRKRVTAGTAPAPVRLSLRCTCYRGQDVLLWLQDPGAYRQGPPKQ